MREDKARGRHLQWLVPVAIVLLVAVVARLFLTRREGDIPDVYPVDGVLDITGMDLSQTVVNVNNSWDFYPNALYTSSDFASGGADRLPEGVELAAVHRRTNGTVVEFKVTRPDSPFAHQQIFEGVYYLEDGTKADILQYSWSYEEDGTTTVWMPLKDCDQDTVLLAPLFSHATTAETPVTIPIK